ncbi:glycosyltransferase family 2 protein [Salinicola halophilus]|uniref:glycosyltransferase family 2 protein n=1 Tax=Salinicola halophilus TaxID=184065 RepID=UPI000DA17018|nr:glycosyltransferase family A protein [Salinicola halophilus]
MPCTPDVDETAGRVRQLTVVVPVYRQWTMVESLLACLQAQTLARHRFRIVLVDNDPEASVASRTDVEVVTCTTPGAYAARNAAIDLWIDETDWFVFTDADCRPAADWLAVLAETIDEVEASERDCRLISGDVVMTASGPRPNWAEIFDLVKGIPQRDYASQGFAATANLAVSAAVFRRVGRFDATAFSGGDRQFCLTASARGYSLRYQPLARVRHPARRTFEEILRKARRVRGAQLRRSRGLERWARIAYALAPPVLPISRLWRRRDQPSRYRLIAVLVQCRLWVREGPEIVRILKGGTAERR